MDCHEAQRIISEALDGEPIAPATVREAKDHCAGCRDCLAYVKSLAVVSRTPLPEPPADLADRVMTRVRAEAESISAERALEAAAVEEAAEAEAETAGERNAATTLPDMAPVDVKALWARLLRPENRRAVAIWAGAAAALVVLIGFLAVAGVNSILHTAGVQSAKSTNLSTSERDSGLTGQSAAGSTPPSSAETTSGVTAGAASQPSADYIVAGGYVYRLLGPSSYARSNLTTGGTTSSSLAGADAPKSHAYYLAPEKHKIVLDDGMGGLYVFELVTRDFAGNQFALRSGDIASYKTWPTLPPPMQAPTNGDGTPEYQLAGTSLGVNAYVKAGTTADAGIAIGPNTPATDPAAGNPNWTWWTPLK